MAGVDGGPGDHAFIRQMMDTRNLRLANPDRNGFTLFLSEEQYGQSMTINSNASEIWAGLRPAVEANLCVTQELGELVLQRQLYMLQALNIVIEDILDLGSDSRDRKKPHKKSDKAATAVLSKISMSEPAKSLSLPDLINSVADQKSTLEDYLALLSTEPVVLTHAVNLCFFSRSELVPDEKGRILPVHTDRYISGTVLEVIYNAIKSTAMWTYIDRLLQLFASLPVKDKIYRAIVLQEISNVCQLEYGRAQALFKRNVQTGTGSKWFKRISNTTDRAGNARVVIKGDPEALTRKNPQLHYMLRLCQLETDSAKATDWMKKLSELHNGWPSEREKLEEREAESFSDLAVITSFIQDLSSSISMPSISRKKNQIFIARSLVLDAEMNDLKSKIDLRDFVVPIDNLIEPRVASNALDHLDCFIIENANTKMGFLYQDLIEECLFEIETQYNLAKKQAEQPAEVIAAPLPVPETREKYNEQIKRKEKTRPSHSSIFEIVATPEEEPVEEEQSTIFKVRASTANVFSTLFDRTESRGSISWTAFVSAMTDLGFSVEPKFGSVYTFLPSESMNVSKSLTLHRPHKSEIERYHAIVYAKRLKRVYGWSEKSFEVDECGYGKS